MPSVETLEKLARALEMPFYQLFYEGEKPPKIPDILMMTSAASAVWGSTDKDAEYFNKLLRLLKIGESNRKLVLHIAQKMANR